MSLRKLIRNIKFLSHTDLRSCDVLGFNTEEFMSNILYFVPNASISRPKIFDDKKTVDLLCKTTKSFVRFGDGEISIINGHDIPFQKYDARLAKRMREILLNTNDDLFVGINFWYFYPVYNPNNNETVRRFMLYSMPKLRKALMLLIDFSSQYYDAGFTGLAQDDSKTNEVLFKKMRHIWNNKNVVCVGCREAHKKYDYNLFDNAASENWVYVPNKNAFDEYDSILNKIKKFSKKHIIILMAGPTSKVLAYDLTKIGYRALDLGHMAKAWDFCCKKILINSETTYDFYNPDE